MIELLVGALLATGAVWFVLHPIFRPDAAGKGKGERGEVERPAAAEYCGRCGTALEADAGFCSRCGAPAA